MADYPAYKFTLEGFCDERGSDSYNLAVGDSRALRTQISIYFNGSKLVKLRELGTSTFKERLAVNADGKNSGC